MSRQTFDGLVLAWLRDNGHPEATRVVRVVPVGTDWEGGTEGGFYSTFGVDIQFEPNGRMSVEGEAMASLWLAVVASDDTQPAKIAPLTDDARPTP